MKSETVRLHDLEALEVETHTTPRPRVVLAHVNREGTREVVLDARELMALAAALLRSAAYIASISPQGVRS